MKKIILFGCFATSLLIISCNNTKKESGTHTHDDGSTHTDHDTTKPVQQEFNVADTTKKDTSHTHDNGDKHSH
jgi:hypothetical protein